MDDDNDRHSTGRVMDDARNRMFGAGVVEDPHPTYQGLRHECPVHRGSIGAQFPEMAALMPAAERRPTMFSTFQYDVAIDVLRDAQTFLSAPPYKGLANSIGATLVSMDEPEHRRMRTLVQPAFARREMERWKARIIQPIVDEHLDPIVALGRADLYRELGMPVPVHTISAALGLPVEDRARFFEWAIAMTSEAADPTEKQGASEALAEYIRPLIASRRTEPRDDLLTTLVEARVSESHEVSDVDRRPLSDDEISGFVRLFIIAGSNTTYRGFGILMFHLLTNPDQLAAVAADRSLLSAAIHEALRMDQPLAFLTRAAGRDVDVAGQSIPAGAFVDVSLGAANRDPGVFSEPDRFDVRRPHVERQVGFGYGVHRCLGAHLAEAELTVMLERCLDRLPNLRVDPEAEAPMITGLLFRLPTALPVRFDPT